MEMFNMNASGNIVEMTQTNPAHLDSNGKQSMPLEEEPGRFGNLVSQALNNVSRKQASANELFERMITHPDEVEPHDVSIAIAQAEMSLNMAKTIVDRAVKAYNDITGMR